MRPGSIQYTPEIAEEICTRIAGGECLSAICKEPHLPSIVAVFKWRKSMPDFELAYTRACEQRLEVIAEEILQFSDQCRVGEIITEVDEDGKETRTVRTADMVERSKLQVESRKWLLARLHAKYRDRIAQEITGAGGRELTIVVKSCLDRPPLEIDVHEPLQIAPPQTD